MRWRILAMAAGITAFPLALVGASFLIDEGTEDRMRERVATGSGDVLRLLARDGTVRPEALDAVAAEHGIRIRVVTAEDTLDADHDGSAWRPVFFDEDGVPTARELDGALPSLAERPEVRGASRDAAVGCRTAPGGRLSVCHAARRARVGDAEVIVYAQESSRRSIRALFDLRYQLLKLTLVVLPLSLLLAWWLGWRFVRPIERLRDQVRAHERSGRRLPIALDRGDELGELATAFDRLVGRLDARARDHEAFLADVAHELKSPVATVRACAETIDGRALDPARAARLARALDGSARRMEALLGRLLELARAEAGMPDADRAAVALGPLVRDVVDDAALRHPGVALVVDAEDEGEVVGARDALEAAVRNLVDNAASFGRRVSATVAREDDRVAITVSDDGPGIPPEDLGRVFDRFFTTRPRDEGTGLGLSLVRAVAEAHGGGVTAASPLGGGARFTLWLPA